MRFTLSAASLAFLCACTPTHDLSARHGSPQHTYVCADGKTFLSRQIITSEVEITAGGETHDVTNSDGDPAPGDHGISYVDGAASLTGFPGGPYQGCTLNDGET